MSFAVAGIFSHEAGHGGSQARGMLIIGLTGSIGMGKSTCAAMFRDEGVPVHDSDAAVHDLYRGAAAPLIEAAFPGTVHDGIVDRPRLSQRVLGDRDALKTLERVVHPLVAADRDAFLSAATAKGERIVVFDIPLLFETGGERACDVICVVSASFDVQKQRVLGRPGMTEDKFLAIIAKQMPDEEKRRRAHFVIWSDRGFASARRQVKDLLRCVEAMPGSLARRSRSR